MIITWNYPCLETENLGMSDAEDNHRGGHHFRVLLVDFPEASVWSCLQLVGPRQPSLFFSRFFTCSYVMCKSFLAWLPQGNPFWPSWLPLVSSCRHSHKRYSELLLLGLDKLHELTSTAARPFELRVDLQTFNESAYATYDHFQVASSRDRYKLSVGKYRGTAGKEPTSVGNIVP